MVTSLARRFLAKNLGLLALAPLLGLAACSQTSAAGSGDVRFAISTTTASAAAVPAVRVNDVRVLSRQVNLQEPVVMGAAGKDVTVTFALRQREGATVNMDAKSLEARGSAPYSYPSGPRPTTPAFFGSEPSRVSLDDGSSLACWTDETAGRVLVQAFGADGSWRGSPVAVSPEGMEAFGAPRVATADGRHVVVTFFASDEERFQLVAASLEPAR